MEDRAWHDDSYPELRAGPPWVMEEMILSQPALAEPILRSEAAQPIADAIEAAVAKAAPLGGGVALQLLTLELAHERGTNPDLIRREEAPHRRAASVGDGGEW